MKKIIFALLCVWLALPTAGATGLTVSNPQTDSNGVIWYDATSPYNGPGSTILRVLPPTNPASGMPHRFLYVLPAISEVNLQDEFGDGLEELRELGVHNAYNTHIIAPSFQAEPWSANHASDPERQYESFMVHDLVPWVQANLSVTGVEEHWLIGFSKSGFGAVTLLFRNPTVFDAAAAWDFPADQPDTGDFDMLDNYGTEDNFQANYRLTDSWIATRKEPFQTSLRLWISGDDVTYFGIPTFQEEVVAFAGRLCANGVQFTLAGDGTLEREHSWTSGWLPQAVAGLQGGQPTSCPIDPPDSDPPPPPPPTPDPSSASDDFNRTDGALGANWLQDPWWGNGTAIADNAVVSTLGNGGAYYWRATGFGADQYSQITLTGAIGDWTGVVVRGGDAPRQGYWVAVKPDGAHLYALVNNVFEELGHDPTPWATGDALRLEVRTVAATTARLTVYRNETVLFTRDDASTVITSGQPGIGLHAGAAVALDDWQGGEVDPSEQPPPPPHPWSASDDFNRTDGALGVNWLQDPWWGNGTAIGGHAVVATLDNGGAYYWRATGFGADQYSQITLTGAIGDWTGVVVRGGDAPRQGYWVAVKPDGAHLYALVNNVFEELGHDPTPWATGDALRLEVRTVAATTARLTVYRNEAVLFTRDDVDTVITSGQPGIGLHAGAAVALDDWEGGEVDPGEQPPPPPHPWSASDDFNRTDGALGANWLQDQDPLWGNGTAIAGNAVVSTLGNGGAYYWYATGFGADQYSQITLTGAIGDWTGVVVRGSSTPGQGYWVAVKSDGAHLYALVNNVFEELGHDSTLWATGDALRLEVRTVAATTARLTVYQNGSLLFSYDDADSLITSGQPGIGLHATTAESLDDWQGGELHPWSAHDDFNRADGGLGASWFQDPWWGNGTAIASNAVVATSGNGGAYYWYGTGFGADQYSQITLTGATGDWTGVVVRGSDAPRQGYWVAVKSDGAHLYALVNGVFEELGHDPTLWATGDALRLEVRTVAATTARLTVYQNGSPLFSYDDANTVITSGQPGIGLYATTALSLDDWEGGEVDPGQ